MALQVVPLGDHGLEALAHLQEANHPRWQKYVTISELVYGLGVLGVFHGCDLLGPELGADGLELRVGDLAGAEVPGGGPRVPAE